MTAKTKADLLVQADGDLASNSSGDINGTDVRGMNKDMIDSMPGLKDTNSFEKNQKIFAIDLVYAATITPDLNSGDYFKLPLSGNPTIEVPSNASPGDTFTLVFVQDDPGGSRQPVWNAAFDFGSGDGSLAGTAGKRQSVFCVYHSSSDIEAVVGEEQS